MQMEFLQSESNAVRRRWILVLVDSTDGVTGKTGQTGTVEISKNGGTPAVSANSIVEVDSANMPGHYYIELTAGELGTLGMISIYYKASGTLAFHDRGFVTYQDPFAATGGFVAPSNNTGSSITKAQSDDLLKKIRKMLEEFLSKDEIKDDAEKAVITEKLDAIYTVVTTEKPEEPEIEPEPIDFTPVLNAIAAKHIPEPKDYSKEFGEIADQLQAIQDFLPALDVSGFVKVISQLQMKIDEFGQEIGQSTDEVQALKTGSMDLQNQLIEFNKSLMLQSDVDREFDLDRSAKNNNSIDKIVKKIIDLAIVVTNLHFYLKEQALKAEAPKVNL